MTGDDFTVLAPCPHCDQDCVHSILVIECRRCHVRTGTDAVAIARVVEAAARLPLDLRVRCCGDPECSMYAVPLAITSGPPPASCPACGSTTVLLERGVW